MELFVFLYTFSTFLTQFSAKFSISGLLWGTPLLHPSSNRGFTVVHSHKPAPLYIITYYQFRISFPIHFCIRTSKFVCISHRRGGSLPARGQYLRHGGTSGAWYRLDSFFFFEKLKSPGGVHTCIPH